jgi:hypothetical protein
MATWWCTSSYPTHTFYALDRLWGDAPELPIEA